MVEMTKSASDCRVIYLPSILAKVLPLQTCLKNNGLILDSVNYLWGRLIMLLPHQFDMKEIDAVIISAGLNKPARF